MQRQQTLWISKKRTLGFGFIALGVMGAIGIVVLNVLRAATHTGIGPAQKIALVGCAALALFGLALAVFGVDPESAPEVITAKGMTQESVRWMLWIRRTLLGIAAALMLFHLIVYVIYALSLALSVPPMVPRTAGPSSSRKFWYLRSYSRTNASTAGAASPRVVFGVTGILTP